MADTMPGLTPAAAESVDPEAISPAQVVETPAVAEPVSATPSEDAELLKKRVEDSRKRIFELGDENGRLRFQLQQLQSSPANMPPPTPPMDPYDPTTVAPYLESITAKEVERQVAALRQADFAGQRAAAANQWNAAHPDLVNNREIVNDVTAVWEGFMNTGLSPSAALDRATTMVLGSRTLPPGSPAPPPPVVLRSGTPPLPTPVTPGQPMTTEQANAAYLADRNARYFGTSKGPKAAAISK